MIKNEEKKVIEEKIGALTQFILKNMKRPVTQLVQAEFNILYKDYESVYNKFNMTNKVIYENEIVSSVEVPEELEEEFDNWFTERLKTMIHTEPKEYIEN